MRIKSQPHGKRILTENMKLKKFFLAVFSNWFSGMSGGLTVPFTVFSLLVPSVAYKFKEPPTVDLKSMKFWAVDSFGGKHQIPVAPSVRDVSML
jgi:hypothetical protein